MDARLDELLPWRHPFVMVDRLIDCVPHRRIDAEKTLQGGDLAAISHRRGPSGFAGAMVLEGMNQSAALLYQLTYGKFESGRIPLLGYLSAEFLECAAPQEAIRFRIDAVKMTPTHGLFHGEAHAGRRTLARSELAFAVALQEPEP
jgi:3-hydroxymyristoyl/3-hydroxydecanoyl-(acyl carrier protein) dehydratase